MRKSIVIMVACCLGCIASYAQGEKQVRNGNKLYEQKKYKEAGAAYQQALQKNPTYVPGIFNLGNSLYQQKQYEASRKVLGNAAKVAKDKNSKAGANYNIGNTYMSEQKWQEAVDAYKQTLRNNPRDADAKYNLSYALQMLKKEQGGEERTTKTIRITRIRKTRIKINRTRIIRTKTIRAIRIKKISKTKVIRTRISRIKVIKTKSNNVHSHNKVNYPSNKQSNY